MKVKVTVTSYVVTITVTDYF